MTCQICDTTEKLQTHHDSYEPEITRTLCAPCHQEQHIGHGVGLGVGWSSKFLENKDEFSRLWDNEFTYNELMNWFDISCVTVYNWANRLQKSRRTEHTANNILSLCKTCGGNDFRLYGKRPTKKGPLQLRQCKACGTVTSEQPKLEESI